MDDLRADITIASPKEVQTVCAEWMTRSRKINYQQHNQYFCIAIASLKSETIS